MPNLYVSAVTTYNGKGLNLAGKGLRGFDKQIHKTAKAFAGLFAARKLYQFGKASVSAFAADEKAARSLAIQLKNTGNSWATGNVEYFIASLQKTTGVLDDELRPAFSTLLTATGDVAKSQSALNLALDISAGTGRDLSAVSLALAKGFGGQTTALSRLGAGLDKATLASGDMDKITAILTAKFSGQAKAAVVGYTGQLALLAVAAANSKEIIGEGLLTALNNLGGNTGISETTKQMEGLAQFTSDFLVGLTLIGKTKGSKTGILGMIGGTLADVVKYGPLGKIAQKGADSRPKGYGSSNTIDQFVQAGGKLTKVVIGLTAAEKAALKLKKDQAALDELKKKFDLDRIGLTAALANSKDEAEKAAIRAKLVILDQEGAAASKAMDDLEKAQAAKIAKELEAATSLDKLSTAAGLAGTSTSTMTASQINFANSMSAYLASLLGSGRSTQDPGLPSMPTLPTNMPSATPSYSYTAPDLSALLGSGRGTDMGSYGTPINIALNLDGKQIAAVTTTAQEAQSQNGGSSGSWSSARYM
jgi:hypothetical protein